MTLPIRPSQGGFLRPFGTAWFIIEFLKGNGPEGSKRIDPEVGAPMTDIHYEYKSALHRAHARDAVEREEAARIRRGQPAFTEEEYRRLLEYYLERIPYKELKMRYASFTRYFGHLKRLGWVKETGETEPSAIQEPAPGIVNPQGRPRVYYHLTDAGWKATLAEISNPVRTLYPHFDSAYFKEKRKAHVYARY
jgi:hypothetical protein